MVWLFFRFDVCGALHLVFSDNSLLLQHHSTSDILDSSPDIGVKLWLFCCHNSSMVFQTASKKFHFILMNMCVSTFFCFELQLWLKKWYKLPFIVVDIESKSRLEIISSLNRKRGCNLPFQIVYTHVVVKTTKTLIFFMLWWPKMQKLGNYEGF